MELGAITAIGRRGYSLNVCRYPALGIKKRNQAFLFFFSPPQDRLDKVFFPVLITELKEAGIEFFSLTKSSLFSINDQTLLIVFFLPAVYRF